MSRIRNKDTKPEIAIRSIIHRLGYRFRKNRKDLPGTPDIVLPKYEKVIFVHGCFWHGHKNCKKASRPSSNRNFWNKKLDRNIARDQKNERLLRKQGWGVMVIWECQLKKEQRLLSRIQTYLQNDRRL